MLRTSPAWAFYSGPYNWVIVYLADMTVGEMQRVDDHLMQWFDAEISPNLRQGDGVIERLDQDEDYLPKGLHEEEERMTIITGRFSYNDPIRYPI